MSVKKVVALVVVAACLLFLFLTPPSTSRHRVISQGVAVQTAASDARFQPASLTTSSEFINALDPRVRNNVSSPVLLAAIGTYNEDTYNKEYGALLLAARNQRFPQVLSTDLHWGTALGGRWNGTSVAATEHVIYCLSITDEPMMKIRFRHAWAYPPQSIAVNVTECPKRLTHLLLVPDMRAAFRVKKTSKKALKAALRAGQVGEARPLASIDDLRVIVNAPAIGISAVFSTPTSALLGHSNLSEVAAPLLDARSGKAKRSLVDRYVYSDKFAGKSVRVAACARRCLTIVCCVAFHLTLDQESGVELCELLEDHPDGHLDVYDNVPTYFLEDRREFRPSLITEKLRVVISKGLGVIAHIDEDTGEISSSKMAAQNPSGKELEIRLLGPFESLQLHGYSGAVEAAFVLPKRNPPAGAATLFDASSLELSHSEVRVVGRRVSLSMRDGVAQAPDFRAFGSLAAAAGKKVCLVVNVSHLSPGADTLYLRTHSCTTIGFLTATRRVQLHFGVPTTENVSTPNDDESGASVEFGDSERMIRWDLSAAENVTRDCAPYLRREECCVGGLWYRTEDRHARRTVPSWTDVLFPFRGSNIQKPRVDIDAESLRNSNASDIVTCIRLIDGYQSVVSEAGDGSFPALVISVTCSQQRLAELEFSSQASLQRGLPLKMFLEFKQIDNVVGFIPWRALGACKRLQPLVPLPPPVRVAPHQPNQLPVVFAMRAYKNLDFLRLQLTAFRELASPSIVLLHISAGWRVTAEERSGLANLNATHPMVLLVPIRIDVEAARATQHAENFRFLLSAGIPFSHVIIWAANEILCRAGIVEYVQRYDMSSLERMDAREGLAYANTDVPIEYRTQEEHLTQRHRLWPWLPWDGVSGEPMLAALLREQVARGEKDEDVASLFPTHQILQEGCFLSRELAGEFLRANDLLSKRRYQCLGAGNSCENELYPTLLMRRRCDERRGGSPLSNGLRCGSRVSTMLWREMFYYGNQVSFQELRCSPFEVPFGFKRVARHKETDAIIVLMRELLANSTRARLLRDEEMFCDMTSEQRWALRYALHQRFVNGI